MKLQPLSKSKYGDFLKCPWKAHALKNLGFEDKWGGAADMGIEMHDIVARILAGEITEEQGFGLASSPEVRWLVKRALELSLVQSDNVQLEHRVKIDKKGKITDLESKAMAHGILDIIEPDEGSGILRVDDWKSGKWEKDNEFERHLYAGVLAHALFPDYPKIRFNLIFVRSGNILTSDYAYAKKGDVTITAPDGSITVMSDPKGGMLAWIQAIVRRIEHTPAKPNPGAHCTNWYGSPCVFHGFECPLSSKLPATTHAALPDYEGYKKGFLMLKDHPDTITDPELVSDGYFAATQLEAAIRAVKHNAEEWSRINGSFKIGDSVFGWHDKPSYQVDEAFVLKTLIDAGVPYEDIARCVNVSKTSISKLSKKNYAEIRDALEALAITKVNKSRFGAIESKGELE